MAMIGREADISTRCLQLGLQLTFWFQVINATSRQLASRARITPSAASLRRMTFSAGVALALDKSMFE